MRKTYSRWLKSWTANLIGTIRQLPGNKGAYCNLLQVNLGAWLQCHQCTPQKARSDGIRCEKVSRYVVGWLSRYWVSQSVIATVFWVLLFFILVFVSPLFYWLYNCSYACCCLVVAWTKHNDNIFVWVGEEEGPMETGAPVSLMVLIGLRLIRIFIHCIIKHWRNIPVLLISTLVGF